MMTRAHTNVLADKAPRSDMGPGARLLCILLLTCP